VRPWADINNTGRGLILLSVVNIVCSIIFIRDTLEELIIENTVDNMEIAEAAEQ